MVCPIAPLAVRTSMYVEEGGGRWGGRQKYVGLSERDKGSDKIGDLRILTNGPLTIRYPGVVVL